MVLVVLVLVLVVVGGSPHGTVTKLHAVSPPRAGGGAHVQRTHVVPA